MVIAAIACITISLDVFAMKPSRLVPASKLKPAARPVSAKGSAKPSSQPQPVQGSGSGLRVSGSGKGKEEAATAPKEQKPAAQPSKAAAREKAMRQASQQPEKTAQENSVQLLMVQLNALTNDAIKTGFFKGKNDAFAQWLVTFQKIKAGVVASKDQHAIAAMKTLEAQINTFGGLVKAAKTGAAQKLVGLQKNVQSLESFENDTVSQVAQYFGKLIAAATGAR